MKAKDTLGGGFAYSAYGHGGFVIPLELYSNPTIRRTVGVL